MSEHQDFSNQGDDSSQRISNQNELDITATAVPSSVERASETDTDVEVEAVI